MERDFLPISREDLLQRGWYYYDFLLITGDAYVDHPLLRHRHHQPGAGGRGLPGGHPPPAGLAGPCGLHRPGPAPVRGLRQRGQHRLHGGPLHRRQKRRHDDAYPPGTGRASGRTGPPSSTPTGCGRSLGTSPGHRRAGGLPPPVRPLRLLGGQGPPVHPPRRPGRPALLRHGGERPPGRLPPPWPPAPRWRNSLGSKGTCFLAKDPAACRFPGGDGGLLRGGEPEQAGLCPSQPGGVRRTRPHPGQGGDPAPWGTGTSSAIPRHAP